MKAFVKLSALILAAGMLTACGVKGDVKPPANKTEHNNTAITR